MLPIIGFPDVVGEFAGFFRRVFSWNEFRRFKQYLSGLITGGKPTIRSMASRLVDHVDQSSLNRFLTLYDWDEERLNRRRLEVLQSMKEMKWLRESVVAIDDSLLPKSGRKMSGDGRLWDHSSLTTPGKSIMGIKTPPPQRIRHKTPYKPQKLDICIRNILRCDSL